MSFFSFKKCLSSPNHLLKLLIVIGCTCFSIYQIYQCTHKLLNPPISTYYGFRLNKSMRYPSFTFCRQPAFKTDLFPKYGLVNISNLMTNNAFENFNFNNYTISSFLQDTTWSFQELIAVFAFNRAGNPFLEIDVTEFHSITKGRCYTLNSKSESEMLNINGGWWFYLTRGSKVKLVDTYGMSLNGFHIYLHDNKEIVTSESEQVSNCLEYVYLEADEDIRITLQVEEFKKVDSNHERCISNNYEEYSKSRCQEKCIHYQIAQQLNCTLPWLWLIKDNNSYPECSNFNDVQYLVSSFNSQNRSILADKCSHCYMSCDITIFTPMILRRKIIENHRFANSFMATYYTSNLVKYMNERIAYNFSSYIADIGGSLGFLLGLSVIGFIAFLEKFLRSIIKKHFRKEKNNNEASSSNSNIIRNELENQNRSNQSIKPHLYDNLHDFDSDDFRCYQNTLVSKNKY